MTIQIPNPGTGNGATGDNEFLLWSKVKANFEEQTNAASRLVGVNNGNVASLTLEGIAGTGWASKKTSTITADEVNNPQLSRAAGIYNTRGEPSDYDLQYALVLQMGYRSEGFASQLTIKQGINNPIITIGSTVSEFDTNYKRVRVYHDHDVAIYNKTTAAGANVVALSSGGLARSTSSERYKDIIADLELDDVAYANAMQLAPIVYRSTAEADNPNYHYYSFSAEVLGAYDPAFTLWRDTETVTDDEGNTSEQPLDERQAEGINLNAIVAFLHATNVKQGKLIAEQAEAIETLTKRIDDITVE